MFTGDLNTILSGGIESSEDEFLLLPPSTRGEEEAKEN
jgi:hypothetical protein